jgi:hypothetical protein
MSAEAVDTKPAATTQEGHRWWLFAACVLVSLTNERRARDPLLDVTLLRNRTVSVTVTAGLLAALVIGGALLPLLYFLQNRAKGEPNLIDCAAHAPNGCRRRVRARGRGTDRKNRTEKGSLRE